MKQLSLLFDGKLFPIRCYCHIMNLIAQEGISFVKNQTETIMHVIIYISLSSTCLKACHNMYK